MKATNTSSKIYKANDRLICRDNNKELKPGQRGPEPNSRFWGAMQGRLMWLVVGNWFFAIQLFTAQEIVNCGKSGWKDGFNNKS